MFAHYFNRLTSFIMLRTKGKQLFLLLAAGMLTLAAQAQQSLADLMADCPDGGTLTLTADMTVGDMITLSDKAITLDGQGHTISRDAAYSTGWLLFVKGEKGSLTLTNVILDGGGITSTGGLVRAATKADLHLDGGVTLTGSVTTNDGAAVYFNGDEFTLSGTTVKGNRTTKNAAGLYLRGNTVTLHDATVTDNHADKNGGGLYLAGNTQIGALTVSGNTAANGSGVYVYYGDRFVVSPDAAIDDDFYLCDGKKLTYEVTYADGGKPLLVPSHYSASQPLVIDTEHTYDNTVLVDCTGGQDDDNNLAAQAIADVVKHAQGKTVSAWESQVVIGEGPSDAAFVADPDAYYLINRNGNQGAYMYQNGTVIATGAHENTHRGYWQFVPTGKAGRYYLKNATTGQYIQTSNITLSSPVTMGDEPVEFYVARDLSAGSSTANDNWYYLCSTDQDISNATDGTLGLNLGSGGVVAYYIRSGRANSYWEFTKHEYDYEEYVFTVKRTPFSRRNHIYFNPCGNVGLTAQYLRSVTVSGEGCTDELHYTATSRPGNYHQIYTADKGVVSRGLPFTLSIVGNTGNSASTDVRGADVFAYFDWNADGEFDATEHVMSGTADGEVTVSVPDSATLGYHRLRVRLTSNALEGADEDVIGICYDFVVSIGEPQATRTVVVRPNAANRGTATLSEEGCDFAPGTTLTATATPKGNARFVAWKDGNRQVSTKPEYTFTVTQNVTLTAVFSPNTKVDTAIDTPAVDEPLNPASDTLYDLFGRKAIRPQHGIYIINGKKQLIK